MYVRCFLVYIYRHAMMTCYVTYIKVSFINISCISYIMRNTGVTFIRFISFLVNFMAFFSLTDFWHVELFLQTTFLLQI